MMFSDVAMGYERLKFEDIMDEVKARRGVTTDAGLTAEDMQEIVERFKVLLQGACRRRVPPPTPRSSSWLPSAPSSAPG